MSDWRGAGPQGTGGGREGWVGVGPSVAGGSGGMWKVAVGIVAVVALLGLGIALAQPGPGRVAVVSLPPSPTPAVTSPSPSLSPSPASELPIVVAPTEAPPPDIPPPPPPTPVDRPLLPPVGSPPLPRARPVAVQVPAIGVDSQLVDLGLNRDRSLQVPDFGAAGWFTGAPTPGEMGPAVIAAHVSSRRGPDVFYRLRELVPGDEVRVPREDGTTAVFRVDELEQAPKNAFPAERVYGNLDYAGLRLITCGGSFDRSVGHYRDNVIVYASFVGVA